MEFGYGPAQPQLVFDLQIPLKGLKFKLSLISSFSSCLKGHLWLKQIFMIVIKANTERQIPVIRATLVSPPLESASKYVYVFKV